MLQNSLKQELPKYITGPKAGKIISSIRSDVAFIRTLSGDERAGAIAAYQDSMRVTFVLIAVLSVPLLLSSLRGDEIDETGSGVLAFLAQFLIKQHHLPGSLDRKK